MIKPSALDSTRGAGPRVVRAHVPHHSAPAGHHPERRRDLRHRPGRRRGDGHAPGAHSAAEDLRAPLRAAVRLRGGDRGQFEGRAELLIILIIILIIAFSEIKSPNFFCLVFFLFEICFRNISKGSCH